MHQTKNFFSKKKPMGEIITKELMKEDTLKKS